MSLLLELVRIMLPFFREYDFPGLGSPFRLVFCFMHLVIVLVSFCITVAGYCRTSGLSLGLSGFAGSVVGASPHAGSGALEPLG